MLKALRLFAIVFIILAISGYCYVSFMPLPTYKVAMEEVKLSHGVYSGISTLEGRRLVQAICSKCHYNHDLGTLAGRKHGNPARLGDFHSTNITQDKETGIGAWSDEELYYFLKTGVKRNGELAFDMPKYPNLSEHDLHSIIAYLSSDDPMVQPTVHHVPKPSYSFVTKLLLHFWLRPVKFTWQVEEPDTSDLPAFGKYLATAKFSCFDCHSGNAITNNYLHPEKSWRYFQGGNPHANEQGEKVYSSNLTPDKESGIGSWTEEAFLKAVKYGVKPDGSLVRDPMFPFPMLTDYEVKAIFTYLKSIRPVANAY